MGQQGKNLYMNLRKPQPGRSVEKNKRKLGIFDHNELPNTVRICWAMVSLGGGAWEQPKMIVGAQGIPLFYIIRENDTPDQIERDTWEEKAVLAAPLTRRLYKQDNLTVNNIILCNIADTWDAFAYVKPYIKKDDRRTDIKALRSRYEKLPCKISTLSRPSIQLRPSII